METLLTMEEGPTGYQLEVNTGGDKVVVIASRDDATGARMASVVGALNTLEHRVSIAKGEH